MRGAKRLAALGALVLGIVIPSTAFASSASVVHLYFDGKQQTSSDTGFTSSSNVSWGSSASHGPIVGKSMIRCTYLTDSTARCTASIVIGNSSVFFKDEIINFNNPTYVIQGGTGDWAGAQGVVLVHNVSDTASNVEVVLSAT